MSVTIHTDVGDMKVEVFCEDCPLAAENFLALCASDYYNGCLFHRNIKGFIVQTGDPTGTGKGGTSIWNKKFKDEFKENLKHNERGMISMANNGPNTNSSQFFITYSEQPSLDLKYTVFAKVIDGFDTLDELEKFLSIPKL
ncbi:peptidyl-prolyl cis-trans isomerase-like 3 [Ctenocephalides felis]|uniref:peptidyl-prolyl cis-trans isomerase-like 3 n=1 Tax=Ctenocephalides felis TaxID=7515 RepID=UPI000E6E1E05|nr:peptidyl-prolyl cis-trans isomerase-like 3 [Ctenocephalides felis]